MLRCNECSLKFECAKIKKEDIGEAWGTPLYVRFDVCPICGSDDLTNLDEIEENDEDEA